MKHMLLDQKSHKLRGEEIRISKWNYQSPQRFDLHCFYFPLISTLKDDI
jgi:hypothetical protein